MKKNHFFNSGRVRNLFENVQEASRIIFFLLLFILFSLSPSPFLLNTLLYFNWLKILCIAHIIIIYKHILFLNLICYNYCEWSNFFRSYWLYGYIFTHMRTHIYLHVCLYVCDMHLYLFNAVKWQILYHLYPLKRTSLTVTRKSLQNFSYIPYFILYLDFR